MLTKCYISFLHPPPAILYLSITPSNTYTYILSSSKFAFRFYPPRPESFEIQIAGQPYSYSHIQPHNHSLLCSFFNIPVFHSDLRQVCGLQTEGCRLLSVIPIFHLHRCLTALYANLTDYRLVWEKIC